jgi:hypothetical protein
MNRRTQMKSKLVLTISVIGMLLVGVTASIPAKAVTILQDSYDQSNTGTRVTNNTSKKSKVRHAARDAKSGTKDAGRAVARGSKKSADGVARGSEMAAKGTADGVKSASRATAKGTEKAGKATANAGKKVKRMF